MDPLKISPPQETKLHFLDYWRIVRIRKTVIVTVFLLVFITATLVTLILPQLFCSTAQIRVSRDQSDIPELSERQMNYGYDPYFIETELKVIQSEVILDRVIENLGLKSRWGQDYGAGELTPSETRLLLRRWIDLRPVRNTTLIDIRVSSVHKQEAADIANEIAKVYRDYRLAQRKELTMGGLDTLTNENARYEKMVQAVQVELDQMRTNLDISETEAAGTGPSPVIETVALQHMQAQLMEAAAQYVKEDKLLSALKLLSRAELKNAVPTAAPDQLLLQLLTDLAAAENKLVALRKDYGPENPDVQRVAALVDDLNTKVDDRLKGIIQGLDARVNSLKAWVDKLESDVKTARALDQEKAAKSRPYWDKKRELEQLLRLGQTLQMKIAFESVDVKLPKTTMVEIIERAEPGLRPVRPNKPLNITLGIILGLVIGVGLAFFIEYLDTSVKTIDDVERALQAPVLGVIPQNVGLLIDEGVESPHAEAYRVLRTNLLFSRKDDKLNTLCVVSAGAGEGKSTTVMNLATVFAQAGQRVLIVDSDLRRPMLHKFLNVSNSVGLTNYLLKQNPLEEVIQTTSMPTLDFLPSGKLPSSSMGILSSAQMRDLIGELKRRYDFVCFDSPPIMGVSDASILASEVDLALQVIQYRRYPQPMNIRAKQLIEKVGGNLIGIVLNNINMSQDESYYYYSGYYQEYYTHNEDEESATRSSDASGRRARLETKPGR